MQSPSEMKSADKFLQKYKSHLSVAQIAEGIAACLRNAELIYDDGLLLFRAGRFPRAASIFISALEEVGKVSVLAGMSRIPSNNQALWADAWADFRSHESKSTWGFVQTYPDESRRYPGLLAAAVSEQRSVASLGERFRQAGLYIDFLAVEKRWVTPEEIGRHEAEVWRDRCEAAMIRTQHLAENGIYSRRALEIQHEVFAPLHKDRPRRRDATAEDTKRVITGSFGELRTFYRRLVDEGILPIDADFQVGGIQLAAFIQSDSDSTSP